MEYVVRVLDRKGKLKKERFIFSSACILDKNEIDKKLLKEKKIEQKILESFFNKSSESLQRKESLMRVLG